MNAIIRYFGLAIIVAGAIRLWSHVSADPTLTVTSCLGAEFTVPLAASPVTHCWGCYAISFGMLFVAISFLKPLERLPLRKRIG